MEDLISIIIPVYNVGNYIEKCLDTVVNQTYKNLEIIIVDDGSTDNSGAVADFFAQKDSRIIVIHQENRGLVKARKVGLSIAKGKVVGFVDSDDWIDTDMFETLYCEMKDSGAQIVTSGRYIETEGQEPLELVDLIGAGVYLPKEDPEFCRTMILDKEKRIWGITPNFWNKLFDKELIMKYEMSLDEHITYGEDDASVYPCMAFCEKICVTNRILYHYRMRVNSMSKSSDSLYFDRINRLYLAMKDGFSGHPYEPVLKKSLDLYMFEFALRGLEGLWGINPGIQIPRYFFDFGMIQSQKKIVLYGAGIVGRGYYAQFKLLGLLNNTIWIDKKYKQFQAEGLPVQGIETIIPEEIEYVVIAAKNQTIATSIRDDLLAIGVAEERIFWKEPTPILRLAEW